MGNSEVKLISCKGCGAIIVRLSRDVCQQCHIKEEELFLKVRDFLRTNPGTSIADVAKGVDTSEAQILSFITSGRLERIGASIAHECQTCHKIISSGLICPDCSRGLKEQVSSLKQGLDGKKDKGKDSESTKDKKDNKGGFHTVKGR